MSLPRAQGAVDRVLEVFEKRGLSPAEMRVLLRLVDREASLPEIAETLGKQPGEITRAGQRLATRGLIRWYHLGAQKETRLVITADGLATVRMLLAAADMAADEAAPEKGTVR